MKKILFVLALTFTIIQTGCGIKKEAADPYFNATVLEVNEKSVLVEPFEGSNELSSSDQIVVSTAVISDHELPAMEAGTLIRIVYDGEIAETYPAQIANTFAIYLIDETGELLEGAP